MSNQPTNLLEQALIKIASNYDRTRHLIQRMPSSPLRAFWLADQLAQERILVLVCDVPPHARSNRINQVQAWMKHYEYLYHHLAQALFSGFMQWSWNVYETEPYIIIAFDAQSAPVVDRLAKQAAPYVAARHGMQINENELQGLIITQILRPLMAHELAQNQYNNLHQQVTNHLLALLRHPLKQIVLTGYTGSEIPSPWHRVYNIAPPQPPAVPRPPDIPEDPTKPTRPFDASRMNGQGDDSHHITPSSADPSQQDHLSDSQRLRRQRRRGDTGRWHLPVPPPRDDDSRS